MSPNYTIIYWGGLPGRGEFIRLLFEYTNTPYKEINDPKTIVTYFGKHFAPPILDVDGETISQTPVILAYLSSKLGLMGSTEFERPKVMQLVSTALDLSTEAHDTHHPISGGLYYEDQKVEALRRAPDFRNSRIPKFLNHFQTVLASNGTGVLVGSKVTTADIVLFHVIDGLEFAFPKRLGTLRKSGEYPSVFALKDRLSKELEGYLKGGKRISYGTQDMFRNYQELDGE